MKVLKRHSAGFDGVFKVAVRNFGDVKVLLGGCSSFKEGWSREAARAKLDSLKEVSRLAPKCGDYVALERILSALNAVSASHNTIFTAKELKYEILPYDHRGA